MTAGPRLATALAREIDAPDAAGRQWVHLLPLGEVRTRDGRRYRVSNPRAVVAAFEAARIMLPVDFEHQSEKPGGGPAPAAGWITRLDVRPDGVWGHVEWNAATAAMIRRREYRYLSPALLFDPGTREVLALRSAGLVHHPAMHLKAIASEDSPVPELTTPEELLAAIAEALELRGDADLDAIVAAITDLKKGARPAKDAGPAVDAMAELLRDRNLRVAQLAEQRAAERVDAALAAGYITPAMHGWALDLCINDPASFDTFMEKALPAYAHLFKPTGLDRRSAARGTGSDGAAAEIARALGVKPEALLRE